MRGSVGVLGSGTVGRTLAAGLRDLGYQVRIGSRDGHAVDGWDGDVGTFAEVAGNAEIIVLAAKGTAAEDIVSSVGPELSGKTVLDTTNPLTDEPPTDGVLHFFTSLDESLMERLQTAVPEARFVKAFSTSGAPTMVRPHYAAGRPTMFICGDDADAKQTATAILDELGWDAADMGGAVSARAVEPLCMLWCIPGFRENSWTHAFKLLRQ
jgi:8-hydroxy-5-deazaflavin:NADPH oxidoreductase